MIVREKNESQERRLRAKIVGDFLKSMRQKSGFTQQDLAYKLSYSTAQFVSNWERGVSLPPLEILPRLSNLCKIPPRSLVEALFRYQEEALKVHKKQLLSVLAKAAGRR